MMLGDNMNPSPVHVPTPMSLLDFHCVQCPSMSQLCVFQVNQYLRRRLVSRDPAYGQLSSVLLRKNGGHDELYKYFVFNRRWIGSASC